MKNISLLKTAVVILSIGIIFTACSVVEAPSDTEAMAEPVSTAEPVPTEDPDNPTPGAAGMQVKNPEEIFRFETTALLGDGGETINPNGMLLNIGCEDCQDIFYASRSLTVEEVIDKIKMDFGVEEMLSDENFVRFDLDLDMVRKLEIDLDLIAANKLSVGNEIVNIRIISIKP